MPMKCATLVKIDLDKGHAEGKCAIKTKHGFKFGNAYNALKNV